MALMIAILKNLNESLRDYISMFCCIFVVLFIVKINNSLSLLSLSINLSEQRLVGLSAYRSLSLGLPT